MIRKLERRALLFSAAATLAVTPLVAQEGGSDAPTTPVVDPAADELPHFTRVEIGPRARLHDETNDQLGSIRDYVLATSTGNVQFIVVDPAGKSPDEPSRLVPFRLFRWDAEENELRLPMTEEELARLPEYDPKLLASLGQGRVAVDEGAAKKQELGSPAEAGARKEARKHLLVSEVLAADLHGEDAPFGVVDTLVLDPERGAIAFAFVAGRNSGEARHPLPWRVLEWRVPQPKEDPGAGGHFVVSRTVAELAQSPVIEGGRIEALREEGILERIDAFFGPASPKRGAIEGAGEQG